MVATPPRDRRRHRHGFSDRLSTGLLHPSLAFRCRRRSAARYRLVVFCPRLFFSWRKLAVNHRRGRTIRRRLSRSATAPFVPGQRPIAHGLAGDPVGLVDLSAYAPNTIERRYRRLHLGRAPEAIWHFFKPTTTVDLPLARSDEYYLMFAARPRVALESAGCRKIDLVLNDRPIKTLVLYNGWRDYRIALELDWMTSGNNRLTVNLASGKTDSVLFTALAVYARETDRNRE